LELDVCDGIEPDPGEVDGGDEDGGDEDGGEEDGGEVERGEEWPDELVVVLVL